MRDAIVYGHDWESRTAVERVALGLARAGATVLHCDRLCSLLRRPDTRLHELEPRLYTFKPWMLMSRLNRLPGAPRAQARLVAGQILKHARALGLNRPVFFYAEAGPLLDPLCEAMKEQGCLLVHIAMDYSEHLSPRHVGRSDMTLVFSKTAAQRMRARWGEKIHQIPHGVDLRPVRNLPAFADQHSTPLAAIPRPRLGYAGVATGDHVNTRVLGELLRRRPQWHFVSFAWNRGGIPLGPAVPLPNAHILPWQAPEAFAQCVAGFDVGFMPYDCSNVILYNGPPMKLWDYFALGLPAVATPLIHLWEYEGLVYLGETANELEVAVEKALAEPADSPLRQKRKDLAEKHSVEALGHLLRDLLG